jgi:ATP synthase subunit 6
MVGLIPYSFTVTSSFVITFFLALSHFTGINIIGFFKTQWETANLLLPSGVPLAIAPFLILIELVSYVAKVFSLSIRLFANMMSGHALLKILIGFSWGLLATGSVYMILAILP